MKKRGLSNLVATVLIILLALAAVALVWSFLQPSFESTGVKIDLGTQCLNVDIRPLSCTYDVADNHTASVNVQYSNGDVDEVIVVVDWDGVTNATREGAPSTQLVSQNYDVEHRGTDNDQPPVQASVAAVVTDGVNSQVCPEAATKVTCEAE